MATQIYKNVFVPDHVTTDQFLKTRAYGYLSLYSDVRFKNWQTALSVAEAQNKLTMNNYQAELKALADTQTNAQKSVDDLKRETSRITRDYLTTAERETALAASAQNSSNQFNAGQANALVRAQYAASVSAARTEYEQKRADERYRAQTLVDPARGLPSSIDLKGYNSSISDANEEATPAAKVAALMAPGGDFQDSIASLSVEGKKLALARALISVGAVEAANADATGAARSAIIGGNPEIKEALKAASSLGTIEAASGLNVPVAPGVRGVRPVATDFGATQLSRLRQLYKLGGYEAIADLVPVDLSAEESKPENVLKALGIEPTSSELDQAYQVLGDIRARKPSAPTSSLIDDARSIYSASFERNPYEARLKANTDATRAISDHFINSRLAALPADASETAREEARTGGLSDAYSWIMGGYKPVPAQPTERPLPLVADDRNVPFSRAPDLRGVIKTDDRNAPFDAAPNLMELIKQRLAPATSATPEQRDVANELAIAANVPRREPGINGLDSGYVPTPGTVEAANLDFSTRGNAPAITPMNARGEAVPVAEMPAQPVQPVTRPFEPAIKAPAMGMPTVAPVNVAQSFGGTTAPIPSATGLKAPSTRSPGTTLADRPGATVEPSGDIENLGASSKVSVATASKTAKAPFSVYMPDDTNYQYEYDGAKDAFTVTDGPKNVGRVFPKGTAAYDALMAQGYTTVEAPTPAPTKTQAIKQTVQLTASQLEAQRRADLLASGMELASKPDKLRRILNTTPAGRLVSSLMNAHKQSRDSVTFLQLRQEIERKYIGRPTQIEQAIQILAASFILEAREAEKAAP